MKGRGYVIHNGESVTHSVTKVGIELLGQLKIIYRFLSQYGGHIEKEIYNRFLLQYGGHIEIVRKSLGKNVQFTKKL